jgi:hypothetical protein
MGIRISIVIGLALIAVSVHAAPTTNSWIAGESSFWDLDGDWSLNQSPNDTNVNGYTFITNAVSKAVSIDDDDTLFFDYELTVSNLTVAGSGSTTNALNLTNMNDGVAVPLIILNTLTIGNGGRLQMYNSMLQTENGTFTSGSVLLFALGTNSSPVVVSNNLVLAGTLDVTDGGGFSNATYTLFTYAGTLTYNGLTVGTLPDGASATITNIAGQVNLVVSGVTSGSTSSVQVVSIVRSTNDIVITWKATGAQTDVVQAMNGGTSGYSTNGFQAISGSIVLSGSTTTNYLDQGGATNYPSRYYRVGISQ